jgi:hypothetical protein
LNRPEGVIFLQKIDKNGARKKNAAPLLSIKTQIKINRHPKSRKIEGT